MKKYFQKIRKYFFNFQEAQHYQYYYYYFLSNLLLEDQNLVRINHQKNFIYYFINPNLIGYHLVNMKLLIRV